MLISLSITDDGFKFIFKAFQKKKKKGTWLYFWKRSIFYKTFLNLSYISVYTHCYMAPFTYEKSEKQQ